MSLNRPILIQIPAFDAKKEFVFDFTVGVGSAQILANKLTIRQQSDNAVVYDKKIETFRYSHTMPENTLKNGTYYNAVLTVFDATGAESPASVPIQFWCYAQAQITFTNFPQGNLISSPSFEFEFNYTQAEDEPLNSYVVNLYNASQTLVSTSGNQYVQDGKPPYQGKYLFSGFDDNTSYFVEVKGITINGATVATPLEQFTVKYTRPDIFTLLELKNNCDEGYITVKSNIVVIEDESNPDPPKYVDNKEVDLTESGSWVEWNKGYKIDGDFLARIWFRKPTPFSEIIKFSNTQGQTITLKYMRGYKDVTAPAPQSYFELHVKSIDGMEYYIFSEYLDTLRSVDYYNVWITRVNNIYQLQVGNIVDPNIQTSNAPVSGEYYSNQVMYYLDGYQ